MGGQFVREIKISAAVIGASLLVFFGVLYWLIQDSSARATADALLNAQIYLQTHSLTALAQNKQNAAIAANYQAAMDALIPPKDRIRNFPQWLSTGGQAAGLVTHFSFSGNEVNPSDGTAGYIAFTADVTGSQDPVVRFLGTLEQKSMQYLIAVDSVDAERSGNNLTMNIRGRLFFK